MKSQDILGPIHSKSGEADKEIGALFIVGILELYLIKFSKLVMFLNILLFPRYTNSACLDYRIIHCVLSLQRRMLFGTLIFVQGRLISI